MYPVQLFVRTSLPFDFGQQLLQLRNQRGLSQKELAQKAQIVKSTLATYGNDTGVPSLPFAETMADTFNISLDYLASGKTTKTITAKSIKDDQIQRTTELVQEIAKPSRNVRRVSARQQDLLVSLIGQFNFTIENIFLIGVFIGII